MDKRDRCITPSEEIDQLIASIMNWHGTTLTTVRKSMRYADSEIVGECKWMDSQMRSRQDIIAPANAHMIKVKVTFEHGANLTRKNSSTPGWTSASGAQSIFRGRESMQSAGETRARCGNVQPGMQKRQSAAIQTHKYK